MQKIITVAAMALILGALAPSHAGAQNREHQQMAAELRIVQEQNQQLRLLLDQFAKTLAEVNAALEANQQFQQRRFADLQTSIGNLETDIGVVRERVQDTETRIRTLSDDMGALQTTFRAIPSQINQALAGLSAAPGGGAGAAASADPPPDAGQDPSVPPAPLVQLPATAGLSPSLLFDTAFADYASARYELAIDGFRQLLEYFPQAERADDAQFYIGEAFAHLSQFGEAIAAYDAVIQSYPRGDQANMAIYKRGNVQERLRNVEAARETYQEAIARYPDSQGAQMAQMRLDGLNQSQPATQP